MYYVLPGRSFQSVSCTPRAIRRARCWQICVLLSPAAGLAGRQLGMLSFLVGGMLPGPRHASRGALILGRAAAPPRRLVGPWLCASGTAEPAAPTCPLPDGVLVVHKPQNWTSFDVVAKVRNTLQDHLRGHGHKFTGRKKLKVGHGGTLDPMATGLLVIGVGKGCRALEGYLKGAKSYAAVAQLGSETDSQVWRTPLLTLAPAPEPDPNPGPNPSLILAPNPDLGLPLHSRTPKVPSSSTRRTST